ncbi:MAG TPA: hypothetical protein PK349_11465 [Candidatus Hydrogenedentes bacterium]|nr:hypothetical protein [Candidatus Hydrogenedentota bacterium]
MAAYAIEVRKGYTIVTVRGRKDDFILGMRTGMATQREAIRIWANWAYGLVEDGEIPLYIAESLLDTLERRAEAALPSPVKWLRRFLGV